MKAAIGAVGWAAEMAIDIIVVDDAERGLSLRNGFHDLRAFLVDLGTGIVLQPHKELLGSCVSVTGTDHRHAGLQIFAPGVGNGELSLPFRIGEIQQ